MTRLGHRIPSSAHPGVGSEVRSDAVAQRARGAGTSGFDTRSVTDHCSRPTVPGEPR